jgi:predicted MFS family arabinose efflux permease
LLILSLTHSPMQAGIVSALGVLPYTILGLPAGALVDCWNRKHVMVICDLARLGAAASIAGGIAIGHLSLSIVYLATLISGTAFVFFSIAATSSLRHVVDEEHLPQAVSRNQVGATACGLLGSLFGGAIYEIRQALPFFVDAVSYGASVVGLALIRVDFQDERWVQSRRLRQEIFDGIRWLTRQGLLRIMWTLNAAMALVGGGFTLLLILLARQQQASPAAIGMMFSILGAGGVAGSLLAPAIQRRFSFGEIIIGTGWIIVGLMLSLILAPNTLVLGLIASANFVLMPACGAVLQAYQISLIPDRLQGRVNSAFLIPAMSLSPIGRLLTGTLFETAGSIWATVALALCLAAVALVATASAQVRRAPSLTQQRAA